MKCRHRQEWGLVGQRHGVKRQSICIRSANNFNGVKKEVKSMADVRQKGLAEVGWNKWIFCRELSLRDREQSVWIHLDWKKRIQWRRIMKYWMGKGCLMCLNFKLYATVRSKTAKGLLDKGRLIKRNRRALVKAWRGRCIADDLNGHSLLLFGFGW